LIWTGISFKKSFGHVGIGTRTLERRGREKMEQMNKMA